MDVGQNLKTLKFSNRSALLYLLNAKGRMSRKEIAKALELTPAAVTKICQELIQEGYIFEAEAVNDGAKGRNEVLLELRLKEYLVMGICSDRDNLSFSISGLDGTCYKIETIPFDRDVEKVILLSKEFLDKSGYREKIIGCGVCIVGSSLGYGLWEMDNLKEKLEAALKDLTLL